MEKKPNDVPKPNKENTISLEIAKDWTKRWRDMESTYNSHHDCRAFNIPLIDLQEVIKEQGVVSVRGYIGVEETVVEGDTVFIEKLIIVGVDANGKDMISSKDGLILDQESDDIYDFSDPCPNLCDPKSPLNG
ncbi:hypothetical protein SHK09_02860 [Polaribacter sp. PL03]|uniref:hypothetical protein n=1 Tax=Polaribacter sp. PL03 TaxID=3088353 RepID=UPI0029D1A477|nr:hypothetical protein [Polaribacter sp. PL03]MDX6745722.1 hypothetical protein [Polaribacter sp. PL03]